MSNNSSHQPPEPSAKIRRDGKRFRQFLTVFAVLCALGVGVWFALNPTTLTEPTEPLARSEGALETPAADAPPHSAELHPTPAEEVTSDATPATSSDAGTSEPLVEDTPTRASVSTPSDEESTESAPAPPAKIRPISRGEYIAATATATVTFEEIVAIDKENDLLATGMVPEPQRTGKGHRALPTEVVEIEPDPDLVLTEEDRRALEGFELLNGEPERPDGEPKQADVEPGQADGEPDHSAQQQVASPSANPDAPLYGAMPETGIAPDPSSENPDAPVAETGYKDKPAPKAPALSTGFNGLTQSSGVNPPDTMGAVGIDQIMVVSNAHFRILDRSGTQLQPLVSVSSFFSSLGVSDVFDPKITFDPHTSRFYITATAQRQSSASSILLGVSATSDPRGSWHLTRLQAPESISGQQWKDFPYIGFSNNKITLAVNMFTISGNSFQGSRLFAIDKSPALSGPASGSTSFALAFVSGIQPATTLDANVNTQYMVRRFSAGSAFANGSVEISTLTGPGNAPLLSTVSPVPVSAGWNASIPDARQKDSSLRIESNDDRMQSACVRNGSLWLAHNVGLPGAPFATGRAAVKWWEVDLATSTTVQSGAIEDTGNDFFYFYPSIVVNANDEVMIGFSGSSSTVHPSAYYTFRAPGDPPNTMQSIGLLKAGEAVFAGLGMRWGDYSATVIDPLDDVSMWALQEYSAAGGAWAMWWGRIGGATADTTKPTVNSATVQNSTKVRLVFSESMTDNADLLDPENYTFTGGGVALETVSVFRVNGTTVDVTVNEMSNGASYTAVVSTSGPTDAVGNQVDPAGNTASFTGTGIAPTVAITAAQPSPTNADSILMTATFSELVNGFDTVGEVSVTNGVVTNLVPLSGLVYQFTLTPNAAAMGNPSITATVQIPAGTAVDNANHPNTASPVFMLESDKLRPTVSLVSSASNPTNASSILVTATFSEAVTQFTSSDVSLQNATLSNFTQASSSVYTFNLTPNPPGFNGLVQASIAGSVAIDLAGNLNLISDSGTPFMRTFDSSGPVLTMSGPSSPTSTAPINVSVSVSEGVSNFTSGDIVATNATVQNFAGSGASYSFQLANPGQGTVSAQIPNGAVTDGSGNGNPVSNFSINFDTTAPSVAITSTTSSLTSTNPIPITITFSESVTGFTSGDLSVTGGTVGGFSQSSGSVYTANITPSGQGLVSVNIAGGAAADNAGNASQALPATFTRSFDSTAPTVAMSATNISGSPTNVSPINVSVSFSESVTGFTQSDIIAGNASVSDFSGSGANYTFKLTPQSNGVVTANITAGVANDSHGNGNTAATALVVTFDTQGPTVSMTSGTPNPTNSASIPVTVTLNEASTDFTAGDITPTNATVSNFSGSGTAYSFNLVPTINSGEVRAQVDGGKLSDAVGNTNAASAPFIRQVDRVGPTVSMSSGASNPSNNASIPVTVTFNETVVGFTSSDIVPTNATVGGFSGSGTSFSFNLTPSSDGQVRAAIGGGVATDALGNANSAAVDFVIVSDRTVPTVQSLTSPAADPTSTSPITVTVTFSEDVTGFSQADIIAANATVSSVSPVSASQYTFNLTPNDGGGGSVNVTAQIAAGGVSDGAGNTNPTSSVFSRTFDGQNPSASLSAAGIGPRTNVTPIPVTVTFNKAVTGFVVGDLLLSNATASNFTPQGGGLVYTFNLVPTAQGTVTAQVPANVAQDVAMNDNDASPVFIRVFDSTAPTLTLSPTGVATNQPSVTVTATASETITGFTLGDITTVNATASNLSGSGSSYTFTLTPSANGVFSATVPAGSVADEAGNGTAAPATANFTRDTVAPTVTLTTSSPNPTNATFFTVTATFSEPVLNFTQSDVIRGNSILSNFSGSGTTYTFNLVHTIAAGTTGAVTAEILSGAANDSANNGNEASNTLSVTIDRTAPAPTLTSGAPNPTNAAIPVSIAWSEPVQGFTSGDLAVTGATVTNFSGSGTSFTATITPNTQGLVTVNVPGAVATDSAGNANTSGTQISRTFDNIRPDVALTSSTPQGPINTPSVTVTATFTEPVSGFTQSDLSLTNASVSNFSGSGSVYTIVLTPSGQGAVSISVPQNGATDPTGNQNTASNSLSWTFDTGRPTISSFTSPLSGTINNASITATAVFSESVTGFTTADLTIVNGTGANISGSGTTYTITLSPVNQGPVSVTIKPDAVQDAAANTNLLGASLDWTFDNVAPTIQSISSASPTITNVSPIVVNVVFSESVTGFGAGDLTPTNATVSNITGSGANYAVTLTPTTSSGMVQLDVASSAVQDAAGNTNAAGASIARTFDEVAPSITSMTAPGGDPTNASPIVVTVSISESVTGLTSGDFSVSGASIGGFSGSGSVYTLSLVPTAPGLVSASLSAGAFVDAAGNGNTAGSSFSRTFDSLQPTINLSSGTSNPTNQSPISVTATFSKNVVGFTLGDISTTNGSASNLQSTSGSVYTFSLTPSGQGAVTASVGAGAVDDGGGNLNLASNTFSRTFDTTGPVPVLSSSAGNPTNAAPITVNFTFGETVTDFTLGDIVVTNATKSNFTGSGGTYSAQITPVADGPVTVQVPANAAADGAGNNTLVSGLFQRNSDRTRPAPVITSASPVSTTQQTVTVSVDYQEVVSGVALSDFVLENATLSSLSTADNRTYTFNLMAQSEGAFSIELPADSAQDLAGNQNLAASKLTRTYDVTQPTVMSFTSGVGNPTSSTSIPVTVNFSETIIAVNPSFITATNATVVGLSGSGSQYTFSLSPIAQGPVSATVNAGAVRDAAGNLNPSAASPFTRTFDSNKPNANLISAVPAQTNALSVTFTAGFSEAVTGFTSSDIVVTRGAVSGFSAINGSLYNFNVIPNQNGIVRVNIPANAANDAAGNGNNAANEVTFVYDNVLPSVLSVSSSVASATNTPLIPISITFSEPITGFGAGDVGIVNGSVAGGSIDTSANPVISFNIVPVTDGQVVVSFPAGGVNDLAGNPNTEYGSFARSFDTAPPLAVMTSSALPTTNAFPIPVTVTFNEPVTGFTASDIVAGNADVVNFSGSGADYTFGLRALSAGAVTADIPGNVAMDAATNNNTASAQFSRQYDDTDIQVVLSSAAVDPANGAITVNVEFSKSVLNFDVSDLVINNGVASGFSGTGANYSFTLTPDSDGLVTVSVPASSVEDALGNTNLPSDAFTRFFDTTPPVLTLTSTANTVTNVSPIPMSVSVNEPVLDFVAGDVSVTNGALSGFSGNGTLYTFDVTPAGQGPVTVEILAGAATDAAANPTSNTTTLVRTFDTVVPSVAISSTVGASTNLSPVDVTVLFSEPVTGFSAGDIVRQNATLANFAGSGASYSFQLLPQSSGSTISASIPGGSATDPAGNPNTAASELSFLFDNVRPSVQLTSMEPNPTTSNSIFVEMVFDEPITGLTAGLITATNATVSNLTGTGSNFGFDLTPTAQGTVTAKLDADAVTDVTGNANNASNTFTIEVDSAGPTVQLTSTLEEPSDSAPVPVTVTFNEKAVGFEESDVTVTSAELNDFTKVSDTVYTFVLAPVSEPTVISAQINAGVLTDELNNPNTASNLFTRTFTGAVPTVTLSSTASSPTNESPIPFKATFSETVTGFALDDIVASNGVVTTFQQASGSVYNFSVDPDTDGAVTVSIPADAAIDDVANGNEASAPLSVTYDSVSPVVTLSSSTPSLTSAKPIPVTVKFSKPVSGFISTDVTTTQATVSSFINVSATEYLVLLNPTADGAVMARVDAGRATDAAGNGNAASAVFTRTFDGTAPRVDTITRTDVSPSSAASVRFTVTFTEAVTGINTTAPFSDFRIDADDAGFIANTSITQVTGSGKTYTVTVNTGQGDGVLRLDVLDDDTVKDLAGNLLGGQGLGNGNFVLGETYAMDRSKPTVSLGLPSVATTSAGPVTYVLTYSNDAQISLDENDVTLVFDDADVIQGPGVPIAPKPTIGPNEPEVSTITVQQGAQPNQRIVTLDDLGGNGLLGIFVGAGTAVDSAGNVAGEGGRGEPFMVDNTPPLATVEPLDDVLTNLDTVRFSVEFDEAVKDFEPADVTVTGNVGAADDITVTGGGASWTVGVTPNNANANGTLGIFVGAGLTDLVGNAFAGAPSATDYTLDNSPPTVSVGAPSTGVTTNGPVSFTVTYQDTEQVNLVPSLVTLNKTGSASAGILVSNITATSAVVTLNNVIGDGTLGITIKQGSATDAAGNGASASAPSPTVTVNNTPILVTIGQPSANVTSTGPVSFPVNYANVTEISLSVADIIVNTTGTAAASVGIGGAGQSQRTVTLSNITGNGTLSISVAEGTATDDNDAIAPSAGPSQSVTVDNGAPTLTIGTPSVVSTRTGPVSFGLQFQGATTVNVSASNLSLNTEGNVNGSIAVTGGTTPTPTVTVSNITGNGSFTLEVDAGAATDNAGNPSAAATSSIVTVDNVRPTVTINQQTAQADPTGNLPVLFDVRFSEPVTGFNPSDIAIGGTATGATVTTTGTGDTYIAAVTGVAQEGTVQLSVNAGGAQDLAGNPNTASTSTDNTVTIDFEIQTPEDCVLTDVEVIAPADGANLLLPNVASAIPLTVTAAPDCPEDTASVAFSLDGVPFGTDTQAPFAITIADIAALEAGEHMIEVTATSAMDGSISFTAQSTFTIVVLGTEQDTDSNGIPDNAFSTLTNDGDVWLGSADNPQTGVKRRVGAAAFGPSAKGTGGPNATLSLESDLANGVSISVMAPRALLEPGETAVLIVLLSEELESLLGDAEAGLIAPEPGQGLVNLGEYFEVSIIVSDDGGASYQEIDGTRLVNNPVKIMMGGLDVSIDGPERFLSHPTLVTPPGETGVEVMADSGDWTAQFITNQKVTNGALQADLVGLSVFAPFNAEPAGGALTVNPPSINFNVQPINTTAESTFTVINNGDTSVSGTASVAAPFAIVEGGTYTIPPAGNHQVRVSFTPTTATTFRREVQLTGGGGAVVVLNGEGGEEIGCAGVTIGAGGDILPRSSIPKGDLVVLALLLTPLFFFRPQRRTRA